MDVMLTGGSRADILCVSFITEEKGFGLMQELKKGEKIELDDGDFAEVLGKLGEGGQGAVYEVKIDGKSYALKWYTCKLENKAGFIKNIQENIKSGAPDSKFLWPLFVTKEKYGSFGYIMPVKPKGYSDFSDILNNKIQFKSDEVMVNAALNIVNGFRALHRKGLSYQDLNDGGFFIDTDNGDVLICDNDNVTPDGRKNCGNVGGKPGYMAPEIVRGGAYPNSLTDNHSLAVILFKLFFRHDPLMGALYVQSICITEEREVELYGTKPVFIFDPNDESNRPVNGIHKNPITLWPMFPDFFRGAFVKSFVEGMKNPNSRMPDNEWQKVLVRLRDNYLTCPQCGTMRPIEKITQNDQIVCKCGCAYSYPLELSIDKYAVPLFPGKKLYECHTSESDDYNSVTGEVIVKKDNPGLWGIKNTSSYTWNVLFPDGANKSIDTGSVLPIAEGLVITFKNVTGKTRKSEMGKGGE